MFRSFHDLKGKNTIQKIPATFSKIKILIILYKYCLKVEIKIDELNIQAKALSALL